VAIILFDGGLDLNFAELEGHSPRVVRRLLVLGIPVTSAGAAALAWPLLHLSGSAALMFGAIVMVSGPTVVGPLLESARPGARLTQILGWEGITIDPVGAIIGALAFQAINTHVQLGQGTEALEFLRSVGLGVGGGVCGTLLLWLLLSRLRLVGVLATEVIVAVVVGTAALCDAQRDDTGLIAAILMGVALANLPGIDLPEDRRFFRTVVQTVIGILFISISATVTPSSLTSVLAGCCVVVAGLVLVIRPCVAAISTLGTTLTRRERIFIGWLNPRGIVAASTAATFSAPLAAAGIRGADKLLPATFLVIVGTVTIYGLTAAPAARLLRLSQPPPTAASPGQVAESEPPTPKD
jgi:NhaP-type Na+/H+ or K+/H+ antiporter